MRARTWLRRHFWLHRVLALCLAASSALMFGLLLAGDRLTRWQQLTWTLMPIGNAFSIWWLSTEAHVFRRLLSSALREDVQAPR